MSLVLEKYDHYLKPVKPRYKSLKRKSKARSVPANIVLGDDASGQVFNKLNNERTNPGTMCKPRRQFTLSRHDTEGPRVSHSHSIICEDLVTNGQCAEERNAYFEVSPIHLRS